MKKILLTVLIVFVVLVVVVGGIVVTGNTQKVVVSFLKPGHGFDLSYKVPTLDYIQPGSWALGLPG